MARNPGYTATISRGTSKGKPTLSDSFRYQLQALVDVLEATTSWYARCIKPNVEKLPNHYDVKLVLDQLKYSGMLDIIRIRKEGFPIHLSFDDFISRYRCLLNDRKFLSMSNEDYIRRLINSQNISPTQWQIGLTKVFLRNCVYEPLEDSRKNLLYRNAVMIQKSWKGSVARKGRCRSKRKEKGASL